MGHSAAVWECLCRCLFLYAPVWDVCARVLQLRMSEESLFGYSCRRWCSVCGSLQSCSVHEGKWRRERRGVSSGQRPPAAINHRDGRSTAREVLRLTPASPGGGSYTGLKIHPFPLLLPRVSLSTSLEEEEIKRRRGGRAEKKEKETCQHYWAI